MGYKAFDHIQNSDTSRQLKIQSAQCKMDEHKEKRMDCLERMIDEGILQQILQYKE
jgi:hypothetical protein